MPGVPLRMVQERDLKDPRLSNLNEALRTLTEAVNTLFGLRGPVMLFNHLDMQGKYKIRNLANPDASGDAVQFSFAQSNYGTIKQIQKIGFQLGLTVAGLTVDSENGDKPPTGNVSGSGSAIAPGNVSSSGSGVTLFGSRASMPGQPVSRGTRYFQTDTGWTYLSRGNVWSYESGIDYGTDAARTALSIATRDNGALFLTSDTQKLWKVVSAAWADITPWTSGGGGANFSDQETPAGVVPGTVFTLANAPSPSASLELFYNGVLQHSGGNDYALAGNVITMTLTVQPGDVLLAWYRW